jgi:site-specific recombinase XerD
LTEPEVHGLLRVAGESKRGRAKRDYGLLQLLLQTNLRVGELTSLKLSDVQIRDRSGEVRVREGKGKKERGVPLNASARSHRGQNWRNPGPSRVSQVGVIEASAHRIAPVARMSAYSR